MYLLLCALALMGLFFIKNSPMMSQCAGTPEGRWTFQWFSSWLGYFAEHARDVATFGLAKHIYRPLTTIKPDGGWAIYATVTFRWLIRISMLEFLLSLRGIVFPKTSFNTTVRGMFCYCHNSFLVPGNSVVRRVGIMNWKLSPTCCSSVTFFKKYVSRAMNEGQVERIARIQEEWGMSFPLDVTKKDPYDLRDMDLAEKTPVGIALR